MVDERDIPLLVFSMNATMIDQLNKHVSKLASIYDYVHLVTKPREDGTSMIEVIIYALDLRTAKVMRAYFPAGGFYESGKELATTTQLKIKEFQLLVKMASKYSKVTWRVYQHKLVIDFVDEAKLVGQTLSINTFDEFVKLEDCMDKVFDMGRDNFRFESSPQALRELLLPVNRLIESKNAWLTLAKDHERLLLTTAADEYSPSKKSIMELTVDEGFESESILFDLQGDDVALTVEFSTFLAVLDTLSKESKVMIQGNEKAILAFKATEGDITIVAAIAGIDSLMEA